MCGIFAVHEQTGDVFSIGKVPELLLSAIGVVVVVAAEVDESGNCGYSRAFPRPKTPSKFPSLCIHLTGLQRLALNGVKV